MTEHEAHEWLDTLVTYISERLGVSIREIPRWDYDQEDREKEMRKAIVAGLVAKQAPK